MSFDLAKEYFEQETSLEQKENLSLEDALQEVLIVSISETIKLRFEFGQQGSKAQKLVDSDLRSYLVIV